MLNTAEKKEKFKKLYPNTPNKILCEMFGIKLTSVQNAATRFGLKKSAEHMEKKPGSFKRGHTAWNKGIKGLHFSPETEFKKGRISTNKTKIGEITVRKNHNRGRAEVWIKISETEWMLYSRYLWEKIHGPIPGGGVILFKDGNSLNHSPSNLELKTRQELLDKNTTGIA